MHVTSHMPSLQAEFSVPTSEYPKLLSDFDHLAASFQLKRFGTGLSESQGLFAAYMANGNSLVALDLFDARGPGKVTLRLYGDYFSDVLEREKFVFAVASIVDRYHGKLVPNNRAKKGT